MGEGKMNVLWNEGWAFVKLPLNSTLSQAWAAEKVIVTLPHDYLIHDANHLYEDSDGWYFKTLMVSHDMGNKAVCLGFDGVYMDAEIWLDSMLLCVHRHGYTSFWIDLTERLSEGRHQIAVHIRHQSPNSRWYSGAGIYRDVRLLVMPKRHLIPDGLRVDTRQKDGMWILEAEAELAGWDSDVSDLPVMSVWDRTGTCLGQAVMEPEENSVKEEAYDCNGKRICRVRREMAFAGITPWSLEDPVLYTLTLSWEGEKTSVRVGFREICYTADDGFFLNGKHVKLKGVCLHHDLGALGSAFREKAARRQLLLMKAMGANALRTSHNPPARQLLDLCDEMGILVEDEIYDMWEIPKTAYDHARFFTDVWKEDIEAFVRRDRCHPCVILWSVGNEIPDLIDGGKGEMYTALLKQEVEKHDPCHARVTFASNYMPWDGAQRCADIVKIPGYNYAEKYYAEHHEKHPDWIIYGSETASTVQSRGIYHFPMRAEILSDEDEQCSSLLNSHTSWGTQDVCRMLEEDLKTAYSLGQFIWTGIDYIGEPTPYHTRNSYFGQADTACFPKDSFYLYQAAWTDQPVLHIGIYWDWNQGQLIDVPVMTNLARTELILNGRSLGIKETDETETARFLRVWQVPYEEGELLARGYDREGNLICEDRRHSFGEASRIFLHAEENTLTAGTGDICFLTITVLDPDGYPVENANNRVHVKVKGAGMLLGLDNGDSTDPDGYQVTSRRLFSGRLLAMIGAGSEEGVIQAEVTGKGLSGARMELPVAPFPGKEDPICDTQSEILSVERRLFDDVCSSFETEDDILVRRIDIRPVAGTKFTPEHPESFFILRSLPEDAVPAAIGLRVINAAGVDVPWAKAEPAEAFQMEGIPGAGVKEGEDRKICMAKVTVKGNGAFYLRASVNNGAVHPRILSSLELYAEGFPDAGLDPYTFISAALHDQERGEITSGNEKGVAFARDGFSAVGFSVVDFGKTGSDVMTLPVFALDDDAYEICVWDGPPEEGNLVGKLPYQKKSIWNTYQEETWVLDQVLKGNHALWFSMNRKIHLKGFVFERQYRAYRWNRALDADRIYGDNFFRDDEAVREIGNNVTLLFEEMDFERSGIVTICLEGATPLHAQAITVRILSDETKEEKISLCSFRNSGTRTKQEFEIEVPDQKCSVAFVFLPGSRFDFYGFTFIK